ncbi:MAG TPA: hypothetical protein VG095_01600 [Chthoniobacterales bacterium]|nr:hypothetical protein [Chthoniobacterales bacterium]
MPAKVWRRVKVYDMAALKAIEHFPIGQFVGLRFHYRHRTIRHLKPNWYQGSLWSLRRQGDRADFDYVQVMVAAADLESFRALPTEVQGTRTFRVYGQVLRDYDAGFTFVRLIGTKVRRDRRGGAVVRW